MKIRMTLVLVLIAATAAAAPLGTEFTYQGVLSDAGTPATGAFDFRFLLYDADVGGSQVGSIVYVEDLTVSDGRMTTSLDFGSVFDGTALWLEVGVRDGLSGGGYSVLSPRQELTAAPFAQHAKAADSATTAGHATTADTATSAGNADALDGQSGSYYLAWSNLVGVPDGLDDGDDDTLGDLSCSPGEIASWNGSAWNCSSDDDTPYVSTYVVGPVGTTTQNGTALRNAIAAITPPTSQEEAVLLVLEPGTYDMGATALPIWAWMTIEGAGANLTVITGAVCHSTVNSGTIRSTSERVGLRNLAVGNTCDTSPDTAVAFDSEGDFATVEHVVLTVDGGADVNVALYNNGLGLTMNHVTVRAENGNQQNMGILNSGDAANLVHITADAHGGSSFARAIENNGASFTLKSGDLNVSGTTAGGCSAFYNTGDQFALRDVVANADACIGGTIGIYSQDASGRFEDVTAYGTDGIELWNNTSTYRAVEMRGIKAVAGMRGVVCRSPAESIGLSIEHSSVAGALGSMTSVFNVPDPNSCLVWIKSSFLYPGVFGAANCLGVYSRTVFYTDTCP